VPWGGITTPDVEDGLGANVHSSHVPSDLATAAEAKTQEGKGVDSTDEAVGAKAGGTVQAADAKDERKEMQSGSEQVGTDEATAADERKEKNESGDQAAAANERKAEEGPASDAKKNTTAEGSNVEQEGDGGHPGSASDYERYGDEVAVRSILKKPCEVSKNSDDPKALEEAGVELPPAESMKHARQAKGQVVGDPNRWNGEQWGIKRGSLGLETPPAKARKTVSWKDEGTTSDH